MKNYVNRSMAWASLVLLALYTNPAAAQVGVVGLDPSMPAPMGQTVQNVVQCGGSPVALEPYDIMATVLEVKRGKSALAALKAANPATPAPKAGSEYLVAHVKMEMQPRLKPGNKTFDVGVPLQWVALSAEGYEYPMTAITAPKPALAGKMRAGSPADGWVAFEVARSDHAPMTSFDPSSGGGTRRGVAYFFRLK